MSWNADIAYAFTPYKILSLPLGLWPLQKYTTFSLIRTIVCGFSLGSVVIMLFLEINFGTTDAYIKLDALMLFFCCTLSVLKLLSYRIYADNLIRNFSSAVNDYFAVEDQKEKIIIMRRHAYMGRIVCYSTLFFAYLASSIFTLAPMLADEEDIQVNISTMNQASELPVPLTFVGDMEMPTSLYMLISMLQYLLLMVNSTSNCGNDSLFLAITLHVCGQLELLKIDFFNYGVKNKNLFEDFTVLVSRHNHLIEHAELLVDVISFVLLLQMLFSCILVCLIGFQFILALKTNDVVTIIKTITVLSALLLQLFFYSFTGDYLKCQMEELADSIYSCNWYNFPSKLMRNIVFVIMRSHQPVQLLAGKFFAVNIETYMSILKSSLSYLSVLRVMMDT